MTWKEIASGITNEDGIFSTTYTGQGVGDVRFKAICEIDGQEIESDPITINDLAGKLILTGDKSILSYADNESCTLTANVAGIEDEKTVHTYTDTNYHETPRTYALQLNSNSHVLGSLSQAEFHINGKTGTMSTRSMWGTFNIGEFNVEKPIFFDLNNSVLYYYDQNDQLVINNNDGLFTTAWALLEGDSFDIIEYPLITFKSNILKSNIVDSNNSYNCSSDDILLDIDLSNMGSNITIQEGYSTIEISKNNTTFTITYDQQSFDTNNSNLILIRKSGTFGIKKDNGEYLWCGDSNISGISIDSGFIVIDEYYYKEMMFNPNTGTNVTYHSQGAGDVTITAECLNFQGTYELQDYWEYIEADSKTFSSSSMDWQVLSDLNGIGDFELTYEISATGNRGFAIGMSSNNTDTSNANNKVRGQVDGAGYYGTYADINGSQTYTTYDSQYSANTYFPVTLQCVDGHITVTHNGKTHTDNRTFNLRYLMIGNWNIAKTINYKNLIIKPLSPDSLSVSANKDILSYADEDECVLTATLSGGSVSNRPVVFKKGNTVLDTVITDSNGVATYTYDSQGVGDVTFTVECMNLIQTYEVQDCTDYQELTSNAKASRWNIPSGVSSTYSDNGWKYGNASSYGSFYLETLISNPSSIEFKLNDFDVHYSDVPDFKLVDSNKNNPIALFNIPFNVSSAIYFCGQSTSHTALKGAIYRIEVNSDSASLYENDVLIKTVSQTFHQSMKLRTTTGSQRYVQIKDLKIKPLRLNLNVTSDKSVLSYVDSDSATLTATVVDNNGDPLSGESVIFKNGDTVLDTVTTDSNGEAEYIYNSQGSGDATITVEYMNLTKTFTIEDCSDYDTLTSNSGKWSTSNIQTSSYSSNGWKITQTSQSASIIINVPINAPFSIEYDLIDYSNSSAPCPANYIITESGGARTYYGGFFFGAYGGSTITGLSYQAGNVTNVANENGTKGATYKFEVTTSNIKLYKNNVLLGSKNCTNPSSAKFNIDIGTNRMVEFKNFKIKPL